MTRAPLTCHWEQLLTEVRSLMMVLVEVVGIRVMMGSGIERLRYATTHIPHYMLGVCVCVRARGF